MNTLETKIRQMAKTKKQTGNVGIEIECEVQHELNETWNSKYWILHNEGSLRGLGYEFVLNNPLTIKDIKEALNEWQELCKHYRIRFVPESKRTSVHVHVNVQEYTILQVFNILCAYWLCEPLLLNICGKARKGNLFCLDVNSADACHNQLIKNLKSGGYFQGFSRDSFRYSAINLEALYKFGSLEFRTMRGTQDIALIESWATELHRMVTNAAEFKTPHNIIEMILSSKYSQFLLKLFSEPFVRQLKYLQPNWKEKIDQNTMLVLDVLNAKDTWDPKTEAEILKKKETEKPKRLQDLPSTPPIFEEAIHDLWTFNDEGYPIIGSIAFARLQIRPDHRGHPQWFWWNGEDWTRYNMVTDQTDIRSRYILNKTISLSVIERRIAELTQTFPPTNPPMTWNIDDPNA